MSSLQIFPWHGAPWRTEGRFVFIQSRKENTYPVYHAVHLEINLVHFEVFIGASILSQK